MANYWGYRIDTNYIDFFNNELHAGRLRQGWGWEDGQDLRRMKVDDSAWGNCRMFNEVKRGDRLLVPRLPNWDSVAVVEATEDWNVGYQYEIDENLGDYGHIFPAILICSFNRYSPDVSAGIRSTLHNRGRFWNINYLAEDIERIVNSTRREEYQNSESRLLGVFEGVFKSNFNAGIFSDNLYDGMRDNFQAAEWEEALVSGLKELFPSSVFTIERTGGRAEVNHGTDILIRFSPPILEKNYLIAMQVKDYDGVVDFNGIVEQINRANYWNNETDILIGKVLIVTGNIEDDNRRQLIECCRENNVSLITGNELKGIFKRIALKRISKMLHDDEL